MEWLGLVLTGILWQIVLRDAGFFAFWELGMG